MIWDVWDWLENNLPETDGSKGCYERTKNYDIIEENNRVYWSIEDGRKEKRKPIEDQKELCIDLVYNLVEEWKNLLKKKWRLIATSAE